MSPKHSFLTKEESNRCIYSSNLFRSYEKWEENEEKFTKDEGAIILDQQLNRKKMSTKNSIKIQKLLNSFLNKNNF
jgi:hypothetical protein